MTKKHLSQKQKTKIKKMARSFDWDELALAIIEIELYITKNKDKDLKLLEYKLQIYESEKDNRVLGLFDMEHFLTKEYDEIEEISDI